jgi:predicted DCC family thiol-disulfide oxidoreductase YuxK
VTAITLVYDGDCPFCSRFAKLARFREAVGEVTLANARERPDLVKQVEAKGYSMDKGMALIVDGKRIYHGADAMNQVALMSTRSGVFNAFTAAVFKSRILSKILYPVLRAARSVSLFVLGRKGIDQ